MDQEQYQQTDIQSYSPQNIVAEVEESFDRLNLGSQSTSSTDSSSLAPVDVPLPPVWTVVEASST